VRRSERAAELREGYGVAVLGAEEAAKNASTLVIAVKPQDMARMLDAELKRWGPIVKASGAKID